MELIHWWYCWLTCSWTCWWSLVDLLVDLQQNLFFSNLNTIISSFWLKQSGYLSKPVVSGVLQTCRWFFRDLDHVDLLSFMNLISSHVLIHLRMKHSKWQANPVMCKCSYVRWAHGNLNVDFWCGLMMIPHRRNQKSRFTATLSCRFPKASKRQEFVDDNLETTCSPTRISSIHVWQLVYVQVWDWSWSTFRSETGDNFISAEKQK